MLKIMNSWIKITRKMQSLTYSLLKKFLLKVQSSTLTFYSQEYPQKMHMTHCPVRVSDPYRITFYKSCVPSFTTHFNQNEKISIFLIRSL